MGMDIESKSRFVAGLYKGEPYTSGEQPGFGVIKLNTNENPYPPAPGVLDALKVFDGSRLGLYPKQDGGELREAIAVKHGVDSKNVFVGNGSDEVLALSFKACFGFGPERPVLFPDVTYSFYTVWCEFFGIPYETIPLGEDFRPSARDYDKPNGGIVICNPNAPTGIIESGDFIDAMLEEADAKSVVIVDEAYADFASFSAVNKIFSAPNLLITRSLSKSYSLAGLRLGYAIGDSRLIEALTAAKDSFNSYPVGALAETLGAIAIEDEVYFCTVVDKVRRTQNETAERFRALGFDVPESAANFVFVGCGSAERAKSILEYLRKNGVYVRYFDKQRICDRLRISIGRPKDMDVLFEKLEEYLALQEHSGIE